MATGYQYTLGSSTRRAFTSSGLLFDWWHGTNHDGYEYSGNTSGQSLEKGGSNGYVNGPKGRYTSGTVWWLSTDVGKSSGTRGQITSFTYYYLQWSAGSGGTVSCTAPNYDLWYGLGESDTYGSAYGVSGAAYNVSATPNTDYYFVSWSDGNTNPSRTGLTLGSDTTLNATFALKPMLSVSATSGGRIVTNPSGRVNPNSSYTAVAEVTDDECRFAGWYSNNSLVSTDLEVSIPVGTSDVSYQAKFVSKWHTVNVSLASGSTGRGTVGISVDGEVAESGVSVFEGSEVTLTCTPKVDYNFSQWNINGRIGYALPYSFIVSSTDDETITCQAQIAERNPYDITVSKVEGGRGTVKLSDAEKSWSDSELSDPSFAVTGRSGVQYTVEADVVFSASATGRNLNKFVGFTKNGSALAAREVEAGSKYTATFTNGNNVQSETLDDIAIVATFAQKPLWHAEVNIPVAAGGTAEISPEPDSTSPSNRWLEGTITIVATPNTGYYVGSINVVDLDYGGNGHVVSPTKDGDGRFRDSFTLNYNARATVNFLKIPCVPTVAVHVASVGAGTATVSSTAQGGATDAMVYGEIAVYEATPASGYSFGGWYLLDGTPAPDSTVTSGGTSTTYTYRDAEYRIALTGDIKLIARFSAKVSLAVSASESASGTVAIDDGTPASSAEKWVQLGDTCEIAAVEADADSHFIGWFDSSDSQMENPLDFSAEDEFSVTSSVSYVARFAADADSLYVALCNYDNDTDEPDSTLGSLVLTSSGATPSEMETCTEADFLTGTGLSSAPQGVVRYYIVRGTSRCTLAASTSSGRGFAGWSRAAISNGAIAYDVAVSSSATVSTVVNRSFLYKAKWGDLKPSRIRAFYANGNNVTNGNIHMEGISVADGSIEDKTETDSETSATYTQNDVIKLFVDIKNGWLFDGWFYDDAHSQPLRDSVVDGKTYTYKDVEYVFVVGAPVSVYAKFKTDLNAIYAWEGSSDNKMMTWKSKVYVGNRPFNPTACRVDACGYSGAEGNTLNLKIDMYSSPDDSTVTPARTATLIIRSQDARRVPRMRPERFMQVQVVANNPVDAIFIGTSMGGLAI